MRQLVAHKRECQFDNLDETTVRSLQYAVTHGRSGKGIVYVFASGNSHGDGADVNQDGKTITRFIISVGSVGRLGKHSSYSTAGAALFVVAPGGDFEFTRSHVVAQPSQGGLPQARAISARTVAWARRTRRRW